MSDRYEGGFIKAVPDTTDDYNAPGVWTLEQALAKQKAGVWPPSRDPYFNQTTLLLHGNGSIDTSGPVRYLGFTDNSSNNFPITVNGDTYASNFSPYMLDEGYWGNYFDGSGDYLTTPTSANLVCANNADWTIEFFIYTTSFATFQVPFFSSNGSDFWASSHNFGIYVTTSGYILFEYSESNTNPLSVTGTTALTLNAWNHVALVFDGTGKTLTTYVNGTRDLNASSIATYNPPGGTPRITIGRTDPSVPNPYEYFVNGYVSNVRLTTGAELYSGATITVPTSPLTTTPSSGTVRLLTCQSNRFVDNSSNGFAITANGNVAVKPLNPFTTDYNSLNGSGYFDGSGDYLTYSPSTSNQFGAGSFTVEAWYYPLTAPTSVNGSFIYEARTASATSSWILGCRLNGTGTGNLLGWYNGSAVLQGSALDLNAWNHVVYVRDSGTNTGSLFLNGTRTATQTDSTNYSSTGATAIIGSRYTIEQYINGYLSNLRLIKGTAVYDPTQTTITVPTTPPTAITNTSLLTCQYQGNVRNSGFIDSGPYAFPITRAGNTTQGTFSPFSAPDGRWSNYFDGTGDYLSAASNAAFALGTGNFTVECWLYINSFTSPVAGLVDTGTSVNANRFSLVLYANGKIYVDNNTNLLISTSTLSIGQWYHIAVVRSGTGANQTVLYINGVQDQTATVSTDFSNSNLRVGSTIDNHSLNGYLSNVRIVKSSVYSTGFTPSTTPLTAITNTSLLTCQSNRFVDNSSNAFAITRNGDVKVTPFSPFAPTAAYDASVNGGSGYFDGSGDRFTLTSNAALTPAGGDFCIECWIYPTAAFDIYNGIFVGDATGGFFFGKITGGIGLRISAVSDVISATAPSINQWTHIAITRSGSDVRLFYDGVQQGSTVTNSTTFVQSTTYIGDNGANTANWEGYISNLRFVKGSAVYTSNFTPSTTPLTAITNTSLLCNFTNAGIFDNTGKNNLETVGNAQIDTTTKKYGTGSMEFDGTGDYCVGLANDNLAFGTGDLTIEFWAYKSANGSNDYDGVISYGALASTYSWFVELSTSRGFLISAKIGGTNYSTANNTTTGINDSTWHHWAICRSNGTWYLFKDGVALTKTTDTIGSQSIATSTHVYVGAEYDSSYYYFNGLIDDLRITKGVARYTANFTPPTGQLLSR